MHDQGFCSRTSFSHLGQGITEEDAATAIDEAWEAEEDAVDMSVRILPGVRAMIDALPEGKYAVGETSQFSSFFSNPQSCPRPRAVPPFDASFLTPKCSFSSSATSGAKTYAYGAMTRVGITPPKVTITADDPRLERGKVRPSSPLCSCDFD